MDWLRKYDRVIQCGKKIVRLTKEDGTTIEFVATKQSNQASTVNQAKVAALEEIRVV
jgi:ribosomal protein S2